MTKIRHADSSPAVKKRASKTKKNDPNAVHDVYTEDDLDPAYDEKLGDDIAFDYEGKSGDPGDRPEKKKK
jgi:hypothetical protein